MLSAAVVDRAKASDAPALERGVDAVAALLDQLPEDGTWGRCRAHLNATMQFAWLLLGAARPLASKERDSADLRATIAQHREATG